MTLNGNTPADLSGIYKWLVSDRSYIFEPASLVIEHFGTRLPALAPRLAHHLQEYNDSGEGAWFCIDEAVAELARFDFNSLKLLGFDATTDHSLESVLRVLLSRGGAIVEMPGALGVTSHVENCFRVALGSEIPDVAFHLVVDPLKFRWDCLISVIGDAFVEWKHDRVQRPIELIKHG